MQIIGFGKSMALNKSLLRLIIVFLLYISGTVMGFIREFSLNSGGYNSLNFILEKGIIFDNRGLVVKLIFINKFLDKGHKFGLIGFGQFQVFLHELNFHVDGSDGLLFLS
jgi:hypothetical protein